MYLSYFNLENTPFSVVPNPECLFPCQPFVEAMETLRYHIVSHQGISLVLAESGLGKSLLLQGLREEIKDSHKPVYLPTTGIPGRGAFLQAILFELKRPYNHLAEQELRLSLIAAARDYLNTRLGVVLLLDEMHLADDDILAEVRCLTSYTEKGKPLFTVVGAGQLTLEDRLASTRFDAFNERIATQVYLDPFTTNDAQAYLNFQVNWAGGDIKTIFTPEAIDCMISACEGNAKRLNILGAQCLVLAFTSGDSVVDKELVLTTINELKMLPCGFTTTGNFSETEATTKPANSACESGYETNETQTNRVANTSSSSQTGSATFLEDGGISFEVGHGVSNTTEIKSTETESTLVQTESVVQEPKETMTSEDEKSSPNSNELELVDGNEVEITDKYTQIDYLEQQKIERDFADVVGDGFVLDEPETNEFRINVSIENDVEESEAERELLAALEIAEQQPVQTVEELQQMTEQLISESKTKTIEYDIVLPEEENTEKETAETETTLPPKAEPVDESYLETDSELHEGETMTVPMLREHQRIDEPATTSTTQTGMKEKRTFKNLYSRLRAKRTESDSL